MKQSSVAWVFIAHSTRDIDKVRQVRAVIENAGGEPILFFLKCITDDDELHDLLKREIEARNFFLLCNSKNARESEYVQKEFRHARGLGKQPLVVIDFDDPDWDTQLDNVRSLVRRATVFLSYAHRDSAAVEPIRAALIENDFAVWDPANDIAAGDSFGEQIANAIDDAARFGYFLHFISSKALSSPSVASDTDRVIGSVIGDRYIPILLEPSSEIGSRLPPVVQTHQWIDASQGDMRSITRVLLERMGLRGTEQPPARDK